MSSYPASPPEITPWAGSKAAERDSGNHLLLYALVVAVVHLAVFALNQPPAIMSPDANGYVVQGRLLATEGRTSFSPTSPVQYIGMHWLETEDGVFHSRYPAGLPLLMAGAWKVRGIDAAVGVNPLLASATVLLMFLLARRFMDERLALAPAVILALVPISNQHALDADAHIAAAFLLVAGVLSLLCFADGRSVGFAWLGGAALGAIPSVRYPEAIVALPIGIWLLWRVRPWWRVWPAVAGAFVPIGVLLVHNAAAYGAFWRTGYALTNEQTGFGLDYFLSHALPYLQGLGGQGLALMFAFGAAGLAGMVAESRWRSEGVLFAGIVVSLLLLYMAYYFGGGGIGGAMGNLRFLIPTFPFMIVAAFWLLGNIWQRLGAGGRAAVVVVVALQFLLGAAGSFEVLQRAKATLGAAARARLLADAEIPAGSVIIADRQLAESLDAVGKWKLAEESLFAAGFGGPGMPPGGAGPGGRGMGGRGMGFRPNAGGGPRDASVAEDTPNPMQRGKNRAQQEHYAGLRPDERRRLAWADLKAWAGEKPVFWFARSIEAVESSLPEASDYHSVAEVDAPSMFGPGGGGGPAPMGGMPGRGGRGGFGGGPNFGGPGRGGPGGMMGGRGGPGPGSADAGGGKLRVVRIEWK